MARAMKDSGIEWIGRIPEDWKVIEVKRYCKDVFPGATPQSNNPDYWDGDINWVPSGSCHDCKIYDAPKTITQAGFENSSTKLIPPKTVLLAMTGATCGNTGYLEIESCANQSVTAFVENKELSDSIYLWYLLQAAKDFIVSFRTGGAQSGINVEDCKNIRVPFLPLNEQQKIAAFLDEKCASIDAVIEKTKVSIDEYKKLKQSVITQAVTKGIYPDRKMKDSEIGWIGEIPEEWNKTKLGFCTYVRARLGWKGLKAEEYVEEGYPLLSAFNIINNKLDFSEVNYINQERYNESPEIMLSVNDILLVKDGAGIGKCAIVNDLPTESTTNGSIAVISVEKCILPQFLYYYFLSEVFQKYIDLLKAGMGVPHLFQADIRMIKIVYPSENEQEEIVNYLYKKCCEIDNIIKSKEVYLQELVKLKKALIYEYVTGKKEII